MICDLSSDVPGLRGRDKAEGYVRPTDPGVTSPPRLLSQCMYLGSVCCSQAVIPLLHLLPVSLDEPQCIAEVPHYTLCCDFVFTARVLGLLLSTPPLVG